MTDNEVEKQKPSVDRISLERASSQKVEAWLNHLQESSKGLLRLTKADIVNFLIRHHSEEFSRKEVQQIRQDHYDPVKHLLWITPKLRAAIQGGDAEMVHALQSEIKGIELSTTANAQIMLSQATPDDRPVERKRKPAARKKIASEIPSESPSTNVLTEK